MLFVILRFIVRIALWIWHPFTKFIGRDNIPSEGNYIIALNHSSLSDPIWAIFTLGIKKYENLPVTMAKKEVFDVPGLRWLANWFGAFPVDRGEGDVTAVKTALKALKDGQKLMIFPQGTRCRNREHLPGKTGIAMFATRTDTMVLPVYLPDKRRPFMPMRCVIGVPYKMTYEGRRASAEQLETLTVELMEKIYALEGQA